MKPGFSAAEVKGQLVRILAATAFKSSGILSGFLRFIVDETLEGRQADLKEYTIGINALSRKPDFNPQIDAIVRIHAGRLRRALKEYYADGGKNDSILIEIPKGGYVPAFTAKLLQGNGPENEKSRPVKSKPFVAVFPFRTINPDPSRDFFADGLCEQLSTELSWFHDLRVISYFSSRHVAGKTQDVKEASLLLGTDYVLTGSIQSDEKRFGVRVQLIRGETGEQLWAKSIEQNFSVAGIFEIQNEIVRSILTAIGGYYGAITRDVLKAPYSAQGSSMEVYDAVFLYYHFQRVYGKESLERTITALEAAVEADPDYALAWAMLGELYMNDKVLEIKKVDNPLELALKCALRAIQIDPNCQHGYQSLAWIYLFYHDRENCLKAVGQCLAINPNAAGIVGGMGFVLSCAGEFDRAFELLNESVRYNPYYPWWFNAGYIFYFLEKKNYHEALRWVEKVDVPDLFWDPLLKAAIYGHLNKKEDAGNNVDLLNQLLPDAGSQVTGILSSFLLSPGLNTEIMDGLGKAGLKLKGRSATRSEQTGASS